MCPTSFADDVKIYREITLRDCLLLQHDLTALDNWSKKWKLNFNYDKCKVLKVARVIKNDHNYVMNNILLENMSNFNDLGINISSDLDWQLHIHLKVNKANSMLVFIKRHTATRRCRMLNACFISLSSGLGYYMDPLSNTQIRHVKNYLKVCNVEQLNTFQMTSSLVTNNDFMRLNWYLYYIIKNIKISASSTNVSMVTTILTYEHM